MTSRIDRSAASQLLDFAGRMVTPQRAAEQLDGSVALYNTLVEHGVAYLADEVGMGKTYVALGVLALLRHYQPGARALVIAPRENLQGKWQGELRNVVRTNVRFPDLRMQGLGGEPAIGLAECGNLSELAEEAARDPERDFFVRLPSFSLALRRGVGDDDGGKVLRARLARVAPWVADGELDLRSTTFKTSFGAAVNCILPPFDLVIIDEAHNLKHGRGASASDRNQVLARVLGHPDDAPTGAAFAGYKRLARWTLLLSATPVEDSYRHLWNQLDLVGHGPKWKALLDERLDEDERKKLIQQFLVRRVTSIETGGDRLTKNRYRREWRRGGVVEHDAPIRVEDDRQRLVVALVQKKVSEALPDQEFGARFQIGMLASFESFLDTAKLRGDGDEDPNFDDGEQTQDLREREGLDVAGLSSLSRSYRDEFGGELPHPKMDAVVDALASVWDRGEKALIFVRRVKSVQELQARLEDGYDEWLLGRLRRELPEHVRPRLEQAITQYLGERDEARARAKALSSVATKPGPDARGAETFFAWFFRGEARPGILDGPRVRERYYDDSVFFEDNLVAALVEREPGQVTDGLATVLGVDRAALDAELGRRAAVYLRRGKPERAERFRAVQAAALDWLAETEGPHRAAAAVLRGWIRHPPRRPSAAPVDVRDLLETRTFFTELRHRRELCAQIWPEPSQATAADRMNERACRAALLSAAARLGHAYLDLYVAKIKRLGGLAVGEARATEGDELERIRDYLDLLDGQRVVPLPERGWRAFDELATLASHFDLVCHVNKLALPTLPPAEVRRLLGGLFGRQQPVGGMAGSVNGTLVQQFRLPGYPFVLATTDVLQEGEDLHTFCSTILHYGISWTPSAMEQRTGRVDRVGSATDRRLAAATVVPSGPELLQVHYPYLEDTVEVLQVDRVFERMNTFLRLMHRGLRTEAAAVPYIDVAADMARGRRLVEPIKEVLESAFRIAPEHLRGAVRELAVGPEEAAAIRRRFFALSERTLPGVDVAWEPGPAQPMLLGTVRLDGRQQPFALCLRTFQGWPVVRCTSPVGELDPGQTMDEIRALGQTGPVRIGAIFDDDSRTYDVTVEDEVLLGVSEHDAVRVGQLVARVTRHADWLEQARLPGMDQPLSVFERDLRREVRDGD